MRSNSLKPIALSFSSIVISIFGFYLCFKSATIALSSGDVMQQRLQCAVLSKYLAGAIAGLFNNHGTMRNCVMKKPPFAQFDAIFLSDFKAMSAITRKSVNWKPSLKRQCAEWTLRHHISKMIDLMAINASNNSYMCPTQQWYAAFSGPPISYELPCGSIGVNNKSFPRSKVTAQHNNEKNDLHNLVQSNEYCNCIIALDTSAIPAQNAIMAK